MKFIRQFTVLSAIFALLTSGCAYQAKAINDYDEAQTDSRKEEQVKGGGAVLKESQW